MAGRKRHSAAQIVKKLEDAERRLTAGQNIAQVCQALEVSEATYHRWRNQYGGMKAQEAVRLKELELENARLKKLLAEAELDKAMLKELASGNF
jgi:transposase-like protein